MKFEHMVFKEMKFKHMIYNLKINNAILETSINWWTGNYNCAIKIKLFDKKINNLQTLAIDFSLIYYFFILIKL